MSSPGEVTAAGTGADSLAIADLAGGCPTNCVRAFGG